MEALKPRPHEKLADFMIRSKAAEEEEMAEEQAAPQVQQGQVAPPEAALQILEQVAADFRGTLEQHKIVQGALNVLREELGLGQAPSAPQGVAPLVPAENGEAPA